MRLKNTTLDYLGIWYDREKMGCTHSNHLPLFLDSGYFELEERGLVLKVPLERLSAFFSKWESQLYQWGYLDFLSKELLPLYTDRGVVLGGIQRSLVRFLGVRTKVVHLMAKTPSGAYFLSKRASHKRIEPGLWDSLAAGLLTLNETPLEALLREAQEEVGLLKEDMLRQNPRIRLIQNRLEQLDDLGILNEDIYVANVELKKDILFEFKDHEVEQVRVFSQEDIQRMIQKGQLTTTAELIYQCLSG